LSSSRRFPPESKTQVIKSCKYERMKGDVKAKVAAGLDVAPEECWMDFDGARMRYLQAGSGPPLILLHGLLGYSFSWRFTIPALAADATIYAPDVLGAGFSDRPPNIDHSMRGTALRILRFADNLGLSDFDLLGTSRGGAVAMSMAAESISSHSGAPRVRRLILVAPVNPFSSHGTWLAPFFGTPFGGVLCRWGLEHFPFLYPHWHAQMFADRRNIPPDSLEGYKAPLAIPELFEHALSIVKTWKADLRELQGLLPTLAPIPTLLMWGSKDPAVYVSSLKPLARNFPNCKTVVFPGIGHLPYEECPEQFNRALVQFLMSERLKG
jgi:pimeloyl-ACP methyl ester carboxylesterase